MGRPLEIGSCRRECRWSATTETLEGRPVFACGGCGSEWTAAEPWTPIDWAGAVPGAVQRERDREATRGRTWQRGQ